MRVAMRQLLSRKSHQKLPDAEASNPIRDAFPPPSDFASERVFPVPNLKDNLRPQSDNEDDILGSVLNVIDEGWVSDADPSQEDRRLCIDTD
jgi:hypothetical protein